jgi:hypothetical protein
MTKPHIVVLRIDVDENTPHPSDWDWATLLDLPNSGGVQILMAQEIVNLDDDAALKELGKGA